MNCLCNILGAVDVCDSFCFGKVALTEMTLDSAAQKYVWTLATSVNKNKKQLLSQHKLPASVWAELVMSRLSPIMSSENS